MWGRRIKQVAILLFVAINAVAAIGQVKAKEIYKINSWETFRSDLGVNCFVRNGEPNCMFGIQGNSGVIVVSNQSAFGPVDSVSFPKGNRNAGSFYNHHHGIKDLHVIGSDRIFHNVNHVANLAFTGNGNLYVQDVNVENNKVISYLYYGDSLSFGPYAQGGKIFVNDSENGSFNFLAKTDSGVIVNRNGTDYALSGASSKTLASAKPQSLEKTSTNRTRAKLDKRYDAGNKTTSVFINGEEIYSGSMHGFTFDEASESYMWIGLEDNRVMLYCFPIQS